MAEQPFRERRISPDEVRQIVRRAVELSGVESNVSAGAALTGEELEARLRQLGLSEDVIHRAMAPPPAAPSVSNDGWLRIDRTVELEGELSSDRFETIAEAIERAMKASGRTSAVGSKLTWTPGGAMVEPSVTIQAKAGVTTIRYVETLGHPGRAKIGLGVLSGFGAFASGTATVLAGAAISKAADITATSGAPFVLALGALAAAVTAIGSFGFFQRSFQRRCEMRAKFAEEVIAQVSLATQTAISEDVPRTRVQISESEPVEEELEDAAPEAATRARR